MKTRTVRVMFGRTFGRLWRSATTRISAGMFLAASSAMFVHYLLRGDGGTTPVAALWAVSAVWTLPVLAALLTMRLIAEDRASGRMDVILTAPVLERDVVLGRFLGAWLMTLFTTALYLVVPLVLLPKCAPAFHGKLTLLSFLPAFGALALQSFLWCACGIWASACFRQPAQAALGALALMLGLPHAVFHAAYAWLPALRARLSDMPFSAHVVDIATGMVPVSTLVFYLGVAFFALFGASKTVASLRFRGRGARGRRLSTHGVVLLAFVFSCLLVGVAVRYGHDVPLRAVVEMSPRTKQILSDLHGEPVRVTSFLAKKAPEFRAVDRLLRGLAATARMTAGIRLDVANVDPRWDLGAAERFVRAGTPEGTIVFERGRSRVDVPVASLFLSATNGAVAVSSDGVFAGEAACASALQNLARASTRKTIYWTTGHGEAAYDSYDPVYGWSEIVRDLRVDGYRLATLDLSAELSVPADCSVLVVAGAREPFSRAERARVGGWLRKGGRLLVLAGPQPNAGVGALLADWGVRSLPYTVVSPRTQTGSDVVVTLAPDHKITAPLAGSTLLFEGAVPLEPVATTKLATRAETKAVEAAGADRVEILPLARTDAAAWGESEPDQRPWTFDPTLEPGGPLTLAMALERGSGILEDLDLRPTRIVVLGDTSFVTNGALQQRANANRDFFLNAVAWLAGLDALTAARTPGGMVVTGLDRAGWMRFGVWSVVVFPGVVFVFAGLAALRRRRRA